MTDDRETMRTDGVTRVHGRSRGLGGGRSSPPKPGGRMTIVSFLPAVRVRELLSDLADRVLLRNCVCEAILQPTWRGLTVDLNETLEQGARSWTNAALPWYPLRPRRSGLRLLAKRR